LRSKSSLYVFFHLTHPSCFAADPINTSGGLRQRRQSRKPPGIVGPVLRRQIGRLFDHKGQCLRQERHSIGAFCGLRHSFSRSNRRALLSAPPFLARRPCGAVGKFPPREYSTNGQAPVCICREVRPPARVSTNSWRNCRAPVPRMFLARLGIEVGAQKFLSSLRSKPLRQQNSLWTRPAGTNFILFRRRRQRRVKSKI